VVCASSRVSLKARVCLIVFINVYNIPGARKSVANRKHVEAN
jgi:hypothetical protein